VGIVRYRDLERVAKGERWTAQDRNAHQPEVREVKRQLDQIEAVHTTAVRQREAFERDHPVRARMGVGQIVELRDAEERAKEKQERGRGPRGQGHQGPEFRVPTAQGRSRQVPRSSSKHVSRGLVDGRGGGDPDGPATTPSPGAQVGYLGGSGDLRENQKLHMASEGIVCDDLNCEACDEKEACERLRDNNRRPEAQALRAIRTARTRLVGPN